LTPNNFDEEEMLATFNIVFNIILLCPIACAFTAAYKNRSILGWTMLSFFTSWIGPFLLIPATIKLDKFIKSETFNNGSSLVIALSTCLLVALLPSRKIVDKNKTYKILGSISIYIVLVIITIGLFLFFLFPRQT
jgi:hypothetical protein